MPPGRIAFALCLCLLVGSDCTAVDNTISWAFPDYELTFHTVPQDSPDSTYMPMLAGRLKTPQAARMGIFCITFGQAAGNAKAPGEFWVYEIYDAGAGRVVKRFSIDELFGRVRGPDCRLTADEKQSANGITTLRTTYQVRKEGYALDLIRSAFLAPDEGLPTGNRLETVYEIRNNGSRPLNLRFSQRGLAGDLVTAHDSSTVFVLGGHPRAGGPPIIVIHSDSPGGNATAEPSSPRMSRFAFRIRGNGVSVQPARTSKVMRVICAGTTADDSTQALRQASNIASYLAGSPPKPDLVVSTTADGDKVVPGQAVTYTISYTNIGTSLMKDVIITNPVPEGLSYLENSAGGESTLIDIGRSPTQTTPGMAIAADYVTWKIDRPVLPGEQGRVFFSAVAR